MLSLLEITFDPFEQARKISKPPARRRNNPTVDVEIRERDSTDTISTVKYYIGKVYYYPQHHIAFSSRFYHQQNYKLVETQREMT